MNPSRYAPAAFALLLATTGCATQVAPSEEERVQRQESAWDYFYVDYSWIAYSLAGRDLNGQSLEGKILDGHYLRSVSLNDIKLAWGQKKTLRLVGTEFAPGQSNQPWKQSVVGAEFKATLDDGAPITLRIDYVLPGMSLNMLDANRYAVSYRTATGWTSLCGNDSIGFPRYALPLSGRWDYTEGTATGGSHIDDDRVFTFACEGYVLEKCVEAGYKPWASGYACDGPRKPDGSNCTQVSLAPFHQACTRSLRADYCGDGRSYTVDGTLVNLYDNLGLRKDTENWAFEAEWRGDGARCVVSERLSGAPAPTCASRLGLADCGDKSHFDSGTLLMTERSP